MNDERVYLGAAHPFGTGAPRMPVEGIAYNHVVKSEPKEASAAQPARGKIRVMLLEDNPGDAQLIQLMIREAGGDLFEVVEVERLGAALEMLDRGGIGVVLSDLTLPDSEGLDTFTQLHARAPAVPIIVLSGLDDTTVALNAVHEGAQDYLVKGQVDGQLLVRAMRYAIERKRMTEQLGRYAEELRTRNAQLEADFNMAREIQEIFLPHSYPTVPPHAAPEQTALVFSHRYLPAAAVGGDFFDVFPVSDTQAGVFICDVMGHGMRAALVTAIMRGLVEELLPIAGEPGRFLGGINRSLNAILRRTRDPFLATAFYAVLDIKAAEIRFANAGHPSPLLLCRTESRVKPIKACDSRHGPALGLFDNPGFPTSRCPFEAGDSLLGFTDGLYELSNSQGEEYGLDRLLAAVSARVHMPTERLLDELLEDVQRFSGSMDFEDDVCLVAVDRR